MFENVEGVSIRMNEFAVFYSQSLSNICESVKNVW